MVAKAENPCPEVQVQLADRILPGTRRSFGAVPPLHAIVGSWTFDIPSLTLILLVGAGYYRGRPGPAAMPTRAQAWSFGSGWCCGRWPR